MSRRKILFFTLLLLVSCLNPIPSQAADASAPVVAPRGITEDVWNTFYKVAFTDGAISDSNLKWGSQPALGLLGNPSEEDLMTLTNLSSGLKKYCPNLAPSVTKSDSSAAIKMYFVPKNEFSKYIEKAPTDGNSYLSYVYYTSGGLRSVTSVINSELTSEAERRNLISIRFLQSLGLMTYTNDNSFKMLSYLYLNDGVYSNNDSQVLALYCSSFVKGGQNFKSVANEITAALNKTPNQAPTFSPTISVEPSESNALVSVSLGSPQNMFISGEVTFAYTITTGNGEVVDSGELSNSTSRLKSDWEFEVNNLSSGILYKFNLTLRNIIGTSKVFSTNFKTTGERIKESQSSEATSEGAEQSISIFGLPTSMKLSEKTLSLEVNTSSGLDPYAESLTPTICTFDSLEINLLKPGKCEFKISQDGDEDFLPAEDFFGSFTIKGSKTTVTCVKGKLTKKVTGTSPKCPAGYKVKK